MLVRRAPSKKKSITGVPTVPPLDSSLTSVDWLISIGESSSTIPVEQTLPITTNIPQKIEATEIEMPTAIVTDNAHGKPPYSYVTLIRQAIVSSPLQRATLNEIYRWIIDTYPYFRAAPSKWKNSIRHNLSLNKCFKRLQRSTNDPGKGSYWAVDELYELNHQLNARKRKFDEVQSSPNLLPLSPADFIQQPAGFYSNNNPMLGGDISSVGGQSSSTDESDSTMSFVGNPHLMQWEDLNTDLTDSFRRFQKQILNASSAALATPSDALLVNPDNTTYWGHDLFPNGETNSFLESIKLASSGEINWNNIDLKPYCEFLGDFRTNSTFQQQDRNKLINLASSLTSFFDYTGITNRAQSTIANESFAMNRLPDRISTESTNNSTALPVVIEEETPFDWESITN